ncbi:LOW QUALITY PROTEIN: hypothetical protein HZS_237 [Henneguya salminicola]|nr:LOW QUALITY PROTEIN: hypothetical protein HZS_237 [Henneguya salminicola]
MRCQKKLYILIPSNNKVSTLFRKTNCKLDPEIIFNWVSKRKMVESSPLLDLSTPIIIDRYINLRNVCCSSKETRR